MLQPLVRALVAAELPVLAEQRLSMWGYVVLNALDVSPVRTQGALAASIGADKTRIIATLDELERDGLLARTPDPEDRRARVLSITEAGRQVRATVQTGIQAHEDRLLARLPAADRHAFLRSVHALSALAGGELSG